MSILDTIDSPDDLKGLSLDDLEQLSAEVRTFIIESVSETGGHLGTNLGVVELTVAMLHVFNPPADKIVWDTTHQTYAHKILTGRKDRFHTLRELDGLCGFQTRSESPYDAFGAGHAGTGLSAALGMATARDQRNGNEHVVAVVGDAAIGCGISFEALNNISTTTNRMIVILNDNEMSIAENVGSFSRYLGRLLANPHYNRLKSGVESAAKKALRSEWYRALYHRMEEAVKGMFLHSVVFEEFGLRYVGPINGYDMDSLVAVLNVAKEYEKPILLHISTRKGKGYKPAEEAPEKWHSRTGFEVSTGASPPSRPGAPKYQEVFGDCVIRLAEKDHRIVTITAGMPSGTGLSRFAKELPSRFFDVGISEGHGVIFAAGLACDGILPVVAIYSTFLQRATDCVIHDVCLQGLPVIFCLDRAGVVGDDGPTHHGVFDIVLFRAVPGLTMMQPKDEAELCHMLHSACILGKPVMIRYPRGSGLGVPIPEEYEALPIGKAEVSREGQDVQIWGLGDMHALAEQVAARLESDGVDAGVVNPRFIRPIDKELLQQQALTARLFVTIENGVAVGGFGSAVQEALSDVGFFGPVLRCGWPDEFVPHGSLDLLAERYGLQAEPIAARVHEGLASLVVR